MLTDGSGSEPSPDRLCEGSCSGIRRRRLLARRLAARLRALRKRGDDLRDRHDGPCHRRDHRIGVDPHHRSGAWAPTTPRAGRRTAQCSSSPGRASSCRGSARARDPPLRRRRGRQQSPPARADGASGASIPTGRRTARGSSSSRRSGTAPQTDPLVDRNDIYTIRPDGTGLQRLTTDGASARPNWTADGRIAFVHLPARPELDEDLAAAFELWIMDADGANVRQLEADNAADLTAAGCVTCPYPPPLEAESSSSTTPSGSRRRDSPTTPVDSPHRGSPRILHDDPTCPSAAKHCGIAGRADHRRGVGGHPRLRQDRHLASRGRSRRIRRGAGLRARTRPREPRGPGRSHRSV